MVLQHAHKSSQLLIQIDKRMPGSRCIGTWGPMPPLHQSMGMPLPLTCRMSAGMDDQSCATALIVGYTEASTFGPWNAGDRSTSGRGLKQHRNTFISPVVPLQITCKSAGGKAAGTRRAGEFCGGMSRSPLVSLFALFVESQGYDFGCNTFITEQILMYSAAAFVGFTWVARHHWKGPP